MGDMLLDKAPTRGKTEAWDIAVIDRKCIERGSGQEVSWGQEFKIFRVIPQRAQRTGVEEAFDAGQDGAELLEGEGLLPNTIYQQGLCGLHASFPESTKMGSSGRYKFPLNVLRRQVIDPSVRIFVQVGVNLLEEPGGSDEVGTVVRVDTFRESSASDEPVQGSKKCIRGQGGHQL